MHKTVPVVLSLSPTSMTLSNTTVSPGLALHHVRIRPLYQVSPFASRSGERSEQFVSSGNGAEWTHGSSLVAHERTCALPRRPRPHGPYWPRGACLRAGSPGSRGAAATAKWSWSTTAACSGRTIGRMVPCRGNSARNRCCSSRLHLRV